MMETTVNSSMCRCCASQGLFKDFNTTYLWMGEEEVYAEMLRFCFDLTLTTEEGEDNGGICEVCITQLRNAANFKKQVQQTEEQFKRRLREQKTFKHNPVKVESLDEGGDSDNNLSEDYQMEADFEVPIKEESPEPKPKKRAAKATTSKAKKPKTDSGETSSKHASSSEDTENIIEDYTNMKIKLNKKTNFSTFISISPQKKTSRPNNKTSDHTTKKATELDFHFDNIKCILRCSNATPIRCRIGSKYACGYCTNLYLIPAKLKQHTLEMHKTDKPECLRILSLSRYVVCLDVTYLECKLCNLSIEKLSDLMYHLRCDHDEPIHMDIKNHIIPFNFETSELNCVECSKQFDVFEDLQEHMSSHYKNYTCELCNDKWFVNRSLMMDHKRTVHFLK